jgi:hypothetical protein
MVPESIDKISALLALDVNHLQALLQIESEANFVDALLAFAARHELTVTTSELAQCKQALVHRWLMRFV